MISLTIVFLPTQFLNSHRYEMNRLLTEIVRDSASVMQNFWLRHLLLLVLPSSSIERSGVQTPRPSMQSRPKLVAFLLKRRGWKKQS